MQNRQIQKYSRLHRIAPSRVGLGCLLGLAALFSSTSVDFTLNSAPSVASISLRFSASPAYADDRDNAREMQEFAREQRREQKRQQREAAEEAKRLEREARQQAREAARAQRDTQGRSSGVGTGWTDRGTSKSQPVSVRSGTSSTTDQALPLGGTAPVLKRSGTSSTTDRAPKVDKSESSEGRHDIEEEIIDPGPPPTVEKWLKQLIGPKPASPERAVAPAVPNNQNKNAKSELPGQASPVKPAKTPQPAVQAATTTKPGAPAPVSLNANEKAAAKSKSAATHVIEPIEFPEFPMPEVLAIDASSETLSVARELGFKAATSTNLSELNLNIRTLMPPKGMTAASAQALLKRKLPGATFAVNKKYRIYRTASYNAATPRGQPVATPGNAASPCAIDRCFAKDVIGWKPELQSCVTGMKIGIIDTAVDIKHPAFQHKKIETAHFSRAGKPGPNWHGTGVTALLAGDSNSGTPGLIPDAKFYVADVFHADEDSEPASDTLSMLRAFDWMEAKGVKIINMSLTGPPDALIQKAITKLSAKGILLVAAAGNDGPSAGPSYPAAYDQVIAVTAVNKNLQNYRYANRGAYIDIAAPGVAIWTALPGSQQGYHSGTSFATPYVTASLAALYPRIAGQKTDEALQALHFQDLGEPGDDPVYGRGLLLAPASCTGGQVASRRTSPTPRESSQPTPSSLGFFEPSSSSPAQADPTEALPWLGLQGSGN